MIKKRWYLTATTHKNVRGSTFFETLADEYNENWEKRTFYTKRRANATIKFYKKIFPGLEFSLRKIYDA
jgi:hypothetical protein